MFTEKEMTQALRWLIGLFEPEDYEAYDEEELGADGGLDLSCVCMALRNKVETAYEYRLDVAHDEDIHYRGRELFGQRAVKIYSDWVFATNYPFCISYEKELWLLEDMIFVTVSRISMDDTNKGKNNLFQTDYRYLCGKVESIDDLFFSPEELLEELEGSCVPVWEGRATIYEL